MLRCQCRSVHVSSGRIPCRDEGSGLGVTVPSIPVLIFPAKTHLEAGLSGPTRTSRYRYTSRGSGVASGAERVTIDAANHLTLLNEPITRRTDTAVWSIASGPSADGAVLAPGTGRARHP